MSNSKRDSADSKGKSYSFSKVQTPLFNPNPNISSITRQPLEDTQFYKNVRPNLNFNYDRQNRAPNTPSSQRFNLISQPRANSDELLDEIFRLYRDNDILKQQNVSLQLQLAGNKQFALKERQVPEAQIRKLKEMLNDKISQCQSIGKTFKKEKEMMEQENERIKNQIKSVIERKNDQIFAVRTDKDREGDNLKREMQTTIDELTNHHRKQIEELQNKQVKIQTELSQIQLKYQSLLLQNQKKEDNQQKQKRQLLQSHAAIVEELKEKYHRAKLFLLDTSKEEIITLQQSSQIQRQVFMLQIDRHKQNIVRLHKQNQQLRQILLVSGKVAQLQSKQHQDLVEVFQAQLQRVYQMKQQQMQLMKVKSSCLHHQNMKAVQHTYALQIAFLSNKIVQMADQKQKIYQLLEQENNKNAELVNRMQINQSELRQEMTRLKMSHGNAEAMLKNRMQTQKSMLIQQSLQAIKAVEMKASSLAFYQEQLRKLRQMLDEKIRQNQQLDSALTEQEEQMNEERERLKTQLSQSTYEWEEICQKQKIEIQNKSQEIQRLNKQILKVLHQKENQNISDNFGYEKQINDLKQRLEGEAVWKQKCEILQRKVRQLNHSIQKFNLQSSVIVNEAKVEWQAITNQRIKEIQQYYKKKQNYIELQRNQLKTANEIQMNKISELVKKYQQLESSLQEVTHSLRRKSQFQNKIIKLGLDTNLVKNKQQLFEY